jgi:hypothetical protein
MRNTLVLLFAMSALACPSANAAISRDGSCAAVATSCTLSATATGSLKLVFAYRRASTTSPTCPVGWNCAGGAVSLGGNGTNGDNWGSSTPSGTAASYLFGCNVSTSSADTGTGTWTNATLVAALSYSGTGATSSTDCAMFGTNFGGSEWNSNTRNLYGNASTTSVEWPGLIAFSSNTDSWFAGFQGSSINAAGTCVSSEMTSVATASGILAADTNAGVASFDYNNWAFNRTCAVTANTWMDFVVEIRAKPASGLMLAPYWYDTTINELTTLSYTLPVTIHAVGDTLIIVASCDGTAGCTYALSGIGTGVTAGETGTADVANQQPRIYYVLSSSVSGSQTLSVTVTGTSVANNQVAFYDFTPNKAFTVVHDSAADGDGTCTSSASGTPVCTTSTAVTPTAGDFMMWQGVVNTHLIAPAGLPNGCVQFSETFNCTLQNTINMSPFNFNAPASSQAATFKTIGNSDTMQIISTGFKLQALGTARRMTLVGVGP